MTESRHNDERALAASTGDYSVDQMEGAMKTTTETLRARFRCRAALGLMVSALLVVAGGSACRDGGISANAPGTPALGPGWYVAGMALTDNAGTLQFPDREVARDLVAATLTYLRITNGPCDGSPSMFDVYEANLVQTSTSGVWSGDLVPVGSHAPPFKLVPDVYLQSNGIMSRIGVVAQGLAPVRSFSVCLRSP